MRCKQLWIVAVMMTLVFVWGTTPALAAKYNLKLAHNLPPTDESSYHYAALTFKEKVEKLTDGQVTVTIFPSSQLGSDVSVAKKVQSGAVEMEILTANKLGSFFPEIDLYSLPFLLNDFDVAARVFASPVHETITTDLEKKTGLKSLLFVAAGFRNITNSKHAVNKPEDLKDLKMRVPKNKIEIATFKALGANPVNIPGSELFSALQQGVVDGQDGSAAWAYAKKVYEVQKYLAVTHHQLSTSTMIINARYFAKLPQDIKDAIVKAAEETQVLLQKMCKDADDEIVNKFESQGMEITRPDLKPFIELVKPVYQEFAERLGGMDRIKEVQAVE